MKLFLNLLILFFTSVAFSQSYVEKQSLTQSNELTNPGFENGKLGWTVGGGTLTSVSHTTKTKNNSFKGVFAGGVTSGCTTITLGSQLKGSDLEFGGQYKYIQNATPSVAAYPTKITVSLNTGQSVSSTVVSTYTATDNDQWLDMPLMVMSVPTSATTASLCFDQPNGAISFGSYPYEGTFQVDSLYLGSKKSFTNGAIIGPTQTQQTITIGATTTAPTKGTIAQDKIEWNREGEYIVATYRLHTTTAGTAGSGDYLISLPNGLSFDSGVSFSTSTSVPAQEVNAKQYGFGTISDGTNNGYVFPVPYDSTRFKLGEVTNAARSMFNSSSNINFSGAVGLSVTLRAKIQGWQGTGVSFDGTNKRTVIVKAKATGTTATASPIIFSSVQKDTHGAFNGASFTVPAGSDGSFLVEASIPAYNFIDSVCELGLYKNNVIYGMLGRTDTETEAKAYMLSGGTIVHDLVAGDVLTLKIISYTNTCNQTNTSTDTSFYGSVSITSIPDINKITGYLSNTVTTSGNRIERMESGIVTGATPYLSNCTTTPCNLVSQSGGASSVTRSGTGVYSINFPAGTFSTPISCTVRGSAYGVTNNAHCSGDPTSSTTTVPLSCQNAATGASVDMQFSYICTGGR